MCPLATVNKCYLFLWWCVYNQVTMMLWKLHHLTYTIFNVQVRAGSRALYRPLSASVLSRPDVRTGEVSVYLPLLPFSALTLRININFYGQLMLPF